MAFAARFAASVPAMIKKKSRPDGLLNDVSKATASYLQRRPVRLSKSVEHSIAVVLGQSC